MLVKQKRDGYAYGKVAKIFLLPAVACLILADTIVDHRTSIVKKAKEMW